MPSNRSKASIPSNTSKLSNTTSPSVPSSLGNSLRPAQRNPFRSLVSTAEPGEEIRNARRLPLSLIDVNPHQARQQFDEEALDELAASIREHDVLQPIGVAHIGDRYRIIFGERRFRAALLAERTDIPAVIYHDLSESDAAVLTALENLQREDLDLEDEARQFAYLLEVTDLSQRALAERLGKTHNYISRRVRLLKERPEIFAEIRAGLVTQRDALNQLAAGRDVYHDDTVSADVEHDMHGEDDTQSEGTPVNPLVVGGRQVGVYHGDTLVDVISIDERDTHLGLTPRYEMPAPRTGIPARWQAITRTYRVLGKIQPETVPFEECEDLVRQLADLETLVATTRRAIQARVDSGEQPVNAPMQSAEKWEAPESQNSTDADKMF